MRTPFWPVSILLVIAGVISWGLAIYLWRKRSLRGALPLLLIMLGAGLWCFLYSVEIFTYSVPLINTMTKLEFLSVTTIPPLWFLFSIYYTNQDKWLKRRYIGLFFIIPVILVGFVLTNDWHHLVWENIYINTVPTIPEVVYQRGPVFWMIAIHDYIYMLLGASVMIWAFFRFPQVYRRQIATLLLGQFFPWLGSIAYLFNLNFIHGIDLTPLLFVVSSLLFFLSIFRFRLFDLVPIARERVMENMDEGVIVLDTQDRIVDINPSARAMLWDYDKNEIGLPIKDIYTCWRGNIDLDQKNGNPETELESLKNPGMFVSVRVSKLLDRHKNYSGRFLVFNDITSHKQMEKREQEERTLAEAFRDSIAAAASSLDTDDIFRKMLEYVGKVVPHDKSTIVTLDESGNARFQYLKGYLDQDLKEEARSIAFRVSEMPHWKRMLDNHAPMIIPDIADYPDWFDLEKSHRVRSYLGAPIIIKEQVIGFLNLDSSQVRHFTQIHADILQTFTSQMAIALQNASLFKEVNRRAEQLAIINRIGAEITSGLDLDKLLHRLQVQVQEAIPMDIFYIAFYDDISGEMNIPLYYDIGQFRKGTQRNLKEKGGLTGYVIKNRKTVVVPDLMDPERQPKEEYVLISEKSPRTYVGVPLISRDQVVGTISMQSYLPNAFSREQIELFEVIATQTTFAIENARMYARMQELATTDVLTDLNNRRQFLNLAENEIERSLRYHKKCSMVMIDIDNYKMINDTFGHGAGDHVLVKFSSLWRKSIRRMDVCGRLGGDEFGLILPETDIIKAQAIAERLRTSLASIEITFNGALIKVTASFGISQLKGKVKSLETLMETADQTMYQAKLAGKNQVKVFGKK